MRLEDILNASSLITDDRDIQRIPEICQYLRNVCNNPEVLYHKLLKSGITDIETNLSLVAFIGDNGESDLWLDIIKEHINIEDLLVTSKELNLNTIQSAQKYNGYKLLKVLLNIYSIRLSICKMFDKDYMEVAVEDNKNMLVDKHSGISIYIAPNKCIRLEFYDILERDNRTFILYPTKNDTTEVKYTCEYELMLDEFNITSLFR